MENTISLPAPGLPASDQFEETVRRERPRLLAFIRQRVRNADDAEDILQDVFSRLLTNYTVTDPIEHLTSWLFHVARNRIIDWYRTRKANVVPIHTGEQEEPRETELDVIDPGDLPDTLLSRTLFREALADALDELPASQREVFILHELEGVPFKEIAGRTGESINTLLSRKRYAVLYLRKRLEDHYADFFHEEEIP